MAVFLQNIFSQEIAIVNLQVSDSETGGAFNFNTVGDTVTFGTSASPGPSVLAAQALTQSGFDPLEWVPVGDWHLHPKPSFTSFAFSDTDYRTTFGDQQLYGGDFKAYIGVAGDQTRWSTYGLPTDLPSIASLTPVDVKRLDDGSASVDIHSPTYARGLTPLGFLIYSDPAGSPPMERDIFPGLPDTAKPLRP